MPPRKRPTKAVPTSRSKRQKKRSGSGSDDGEADPAFTTGSDASEKRSPRKQQAKTVPAPRSERQKKRIESDNEETNPASSPGEHPTIRSKLRKGPRTTVEPPGMSPLQRKYSNMVLSELEAASKKASKAKGKALDEYRLKTLHYAALVGLIQVVDEPFFLQWEASIPQLVGGLFQRLLKLGQDAKRLMDDWSQNPTQPSDLGPNQVRATARTEAATKAQDAVRRWCGFMCMITGTLDAVESAHVIPDCVLRNDLRQKKFWGALTCFWPKTTVEAFIRILESDVGEKRNLLVLDRTAHFFWGEGHFTLRPMMDQCTPRKVVAEFLWCNRDDETRILNHKSGPYRLSDNRDEVEWDRIFSGDIIDITTDDPERCPLVAPELLGLQYHLGRALRASASAGVLELIFHPDDDADPPRIEDSELDGILPEPDEGSTFARFLVDRAVELGVLDEEESERWFLRLTFRNEVAPARETNGGRGEADMSDNAEPVCEAESPF